MSIWVLATLSEHLLLHTQLRAQTGRSHPLLSHLEGEEMSRRVLEGCRFIPWRKLLFPRCVEELIIAGELNALTHLCTHQLTQLHTHAHVLAPLRAVQNPHQLHLALRVAALQSDSPKSARTNPNHENESREKAGSELHDSVALVLAFRFPASCLWLHQTQAPILGPRPSLGAGRGSVLVGFWAFHYNASRGKCTVCACKAQ